MRLGLKVAKSNETFGYSLGVKGYFCNLSITSICFTLDWLGIYIPISPFLQETHLVHNVN